MVIEWASSAGSPPHTWRIPTRKSQKLGGDRITSTYVENTGVLKTAINPVKDHLHIRGEYFHTRLS